MLLIKTKLARAILIFFFFSTFGQNVIILKATWFSEVTLKGSMFITLIFIFRSAKLQSSSSMDLA